jgi:glycerol uptake facilitator-like aquaporin
MHLGIAGSQLIVLELSVNAILFITTLGHLNPAVSLAFCIHRRFQWRLLPGKPISKHKLSLQ